MFGKKVITDEQKVEKLFTRGVEEIIDRKHLEERLRSGEKLRVKLGIDPTAKDLHLGHTVVLRKLRQFQDMGHQAVFIIGDFTATIGDPSGRDTLRPSLTPEQIKENMRNYLKEAGKVINIKKTEVRYNSEWYNKKKLDFLMELSSKFTIARLLERDDFQKRLKQDVEISMLEIMYPILQGQDSLEIKADVELGGTDQKFNLLMGRKVQKRYGQPEQDIMTVPLIEGTDGIRSKSLGNYIGISDEPSNMFGKVMSVPDELMVKYFLLLTDTPEEEIERLRKDRLTPSIAKTPLKEWKERLASELVKTYHGAAAAQKAKDEWERVFSKGELPSEMEEIESKGWLIQTIVTAGVVPSNSEAKRLIDQKAIKVNDKTVETWGLSLKSGDVVQVGPKRFVRIK